MANSVFLSDIDDYLAPSQACVNPLFTGDQKVEEKSQIGEVKTTKRQRRPVLGSNREGPKIPQVQSNPIHASIADCLACSGCVTTAETVLMEEEHSLQKLRSLPSNVPVAATVSPAAWADMFRHLDLPFEPQTYQRFATLLYKCLSISIVMDGNIFLDWSRVQAAEEFCHAYEMKHGQSMEEDLSEYESLQKSLTPSLAVSAQEVSFLMKDGTTKSVYPEIKRPTLPLLSSSCPALVCLVEKSTHHAVPHLSSIRSPMSMAGAALPKDLYHIGIMPCHDKKLEASRRDFQMEGHRDVDIVITTSECVQLLKEKIGDNIRETLAECEPATVVNKFPKGEILPSIPALFMQDIKPLINGNDVSQLSWSIQSSGGYADFIFRYACERLFGYRCEHDLPWAPVTDSTGKQSARVAAQRKRDYYQVTLRRSSEAGYNLQEGEPVLRFAVAFGMQTLQRALKPFNEGSEVEFDYIEAMACPNGCVNGGGQLRVSEREAPSETRERVGRTLQYFTVPTGIDTIVPLTKAECHTNYHVVPPLKLQQGAVAGVAVQDMQW